MRCGGGGRREEGFDHVGWTYALASQLEALAEVVSPNIADQESCDYAEIAPLGLDEPRCPSSDTAGQGERDAEPAGHRELSPVSLRDDPAGAIETLRRHPVLKRALAGSDRNDTIQLMGPYWASRVELRTLAGSLVQLAAEKGGQHAATVLHRLLKLGESNELKAYEITVFDGLEMEHRIDIGDHAYLAPYRQVRHDLGSHVPMIVGRRLLVVDESPGRDEGLMSTAALVRELRWGPAITSDSADLHGNLVTEFPFCLEEAVVEGDCSTFQFPSDQQTFRDLLSIATGKHVISVGRYIRPAKGMEGIDLQFEARWSTGRLPDYVERRSNGLTVESAQMLLSMIKGWMEYRGDRKSLGIAVRRLADSRSRIGRFGTEDRMLDTAIALESMYELSSSEISYRLATRAGHYLGDESNERLRIFGQIRRFYDARSAVVHGSSGRRTRVSQREALSEGFQIARMTLIKLLEHGHPPDWDALVMSSGNDDQVLPDDSRT